MELLVLKAGERYLRLTNEGFEYTGMNKASVYSISEEAFVLKQLQKLKTEIEDLSIKKLTIIESDFL